MANVQDRYDYIIVGQGGAGAVLANRLPGPRHLRAVDRGAVALQLNPMLYIPKGFFLRSSPTGSPTYKAQPFPSATRSRGSAARAWAARRRSTG